MSRMKRYIAASLVLCVLLVAGGCSSARADGGKPQYSSTHGNLRVSVATNPSTARVGIIDVSVLIQDVTTGKTRLDLKVTVEAYPDGKPEQRIGGPATNDAAVNKLYKARHLDIPEPDLWIVEISIHAPKGLIRFKIRLDVAEALPAWMNYAGWIAMPLGFAMLFVVHRYFVRRRLQPGRIPGYKK